MELSEPGWHWRKLKTLLLAEVQERGVEFPARRSCHSTTPGGAGDSRKSVLFLVGMLHKEDLWKARKLWQQMSVFQPESILIGASGGSMDPALSQQPKLQEYFSPVSRHKNEKGTGNLYLLIRYKQVHLQSNMFFGWSQNIGQKFFGC